MIVQASGINARINRLAHSFCSKPLAEINGIFQRERERQKAKESPVERGNCQTRRERMRKDLREIDKIKHSD